MSSGEIFQVRKGLPLPLVLVVPFILQIFTAVGITGYLSFRNGQKTVNHLATHLQEEVSERVSLHLDNYLATAKNIAQINANAIELNLIDLHDYKTSGRYFWQQMQAYQNVGFIDYTLPTGEYVGAGRWLENGGITIDELSSETDWQANTYSTDDQGNRLKIVDDTEYSPLEESWYTEVIRAKKPVWNEIYAWDGFPDILSVAVTFPVYDQANKLIAVTGVDLLLNGINDFLGQLEVCPSAKVFIFEPNGSIIASSDSERPYKMVDGEAEQINVLNSTNPLIRETAKYLQQNFGNFERIKHLQQLKFEIEGKPHFAQVTPWLDKLGLDWLVVVVMPESDFMAEINANNRTTILLCLTSLIVATCLGILTSSWIARPISRLSDASSAIANGDLGRVLKVKGIREFQLLFQSFNQMTEQLRKSFMALEKSNRELESQAIQLQKTKEAAEVANRAKSEFIANMSHELRTPLNAVLGFTQLMNRDSNLTEKQRKNLNTINRSGEHLLSLINDILNLSKIESGRMTLNPISFDLHRLLNTLEEMFKLKAQSKSLELLVEKSPDLPNYVKTDEQKLRQVLINLLSNAIKFTQDGRVTIRISSVRDGEQQMKIYCEIEDTGYGIAAEELDILFKPFVQTTTGKKLQSGTGLGLPISRKFIQLMGGKLSISSILGQGTIAKFDFVVEPTTTEAVQNPAPYRKVIGLKPGQPKYRILVVDDLWENRQMLVQLLESVGFEVAEAENGKEAVSIWSSWQPQLIWMDMRMPVLDGYGATQQIRSHLQGQATAIIALTASAFEEKRELILSAGCNDFVHKPFRESIIWEKMAQYLGVSYVYEESKPSSTTSVNNSFLLEASALQIMPSEWIAQLETAALKLEEDSITELIEQIPDEHTLLSQALQDRLHNFDCGKILDLARQAKGSE